MKFKDFTIASNSIWLAAVVGLWLPCLALRAADDFDQIRLWPRGAPGSEGKNSDEIVEKSQNGERSVWNVHSPSITAYLPPKEKRTGAAVIIAPGGGHRVLAFDHEGCNVAQTLSEHGIAAFVLKYRLARETNSFYQIETHALADTQRAIRYVRSHAPDLGVNPAHIGVMGFSAGGELAALAAMRFDKGDPNSKDMVEQVSSKPDFQALIYPGSSRKVEPVKDSPPVFLACAYNDRPDIAEGLAEVYLRFKKVGVPAELHIYSTGGHGFGVRASNKRPVGTWLVRFEEWMDDSGFLK